MDGWTSKGEEFYAFVPKNSLNRSGTLNNLSDMYRVSDDDFSVSSLTGTDVARDNLAEALKMSRERLDDVTDDEEEENTNDGELPEEEKPKEEVEVGFTNDKEVIKFLIVVELNYFKC